MNRYMTIVSRGSANADANADDNVREGTCGGNQSPKTLSFCQKLGQTHNFPLLIPQTGTYNLWSLIVDVQDNVADDDDYVDGEGVGQDDCGGSLSGLYLESRAHLTTLEVWLYNPASNQFVLFSLEQPLIQPLFFGLSNQ